MIHDPVGSDFREPGHRVTESGSRAHGPSEAFSIARREGPWRDALLRRILAFADLTAAAIASGSLVRDGGHLRIMVWSMFLAPVWIIVAKVMGLYDHDRRSLRHLTADELPRLCTWALACTAVLAFALSAMPAGSLSAGQALRLAVVSAVGAVVLRVVARRLWRRFTAPERAVLIGRGRAEAAFRRKLELFPDIHVEVSSHREGLSLDDLREPPAWLRDADRLVLATMPQNETFLPELVTFCRSYRLKLAIIGSRDALGGAAELNRIADLPVFEYDTSDVSRSTQLLKRVIDLAVSSLALALLSPLVALIALLVLLDGGRPIFFRQQRAGQNGRPFTMLKFRTMVPNAEDLLEALVPIHELKQPVFKLRDDPRVTRIGRVLRRWSLDELPQFANVLRGEMSLVGPRPEQLQLVARYSASDRFRLAVKPGMTGPMQVYGRGDLSFDERLAVERDYVESVSIGRDFHIVTLTIASLFHGRGAF